MNATSCMHSIIALMLILRLFRLGKVKTFSNWSKSLKLENRFPYRIWMTYTPYYADIMLMLDAYNYANNDKILNGV